MRPEQLPQCLRVISESWDAETAQQAQDDLRNMFHKPRLAPFYYVHLGPGGDVDGLSGYIASWMNTGVLDLIWTAVRPKVRKQGIGARLVERCLTDADVLDCAVILTTYVPEFYRPFEFECLDADLRCAGRPNVLMRRRCRSHRHQMRELPLQISEISSGFPIKPNQENPE